MELFSFSHASVESEPVIQKHKRKHKHTSFLVSGIENVNRHIWFPRGELRLRDCHPDGYAYVTPIHAYFPYAYAYAYGYVKVWTSPSAS